MDIKSINKLIELEEALIDMHDSKAISDKTFHEQLIPILFDYIEGKEFELAIVVVQQMDIKFLQNLKKYKSHVGDWESKAYTVYVELGLAYCKPKFSGVMN